MMAAPRHARLQRGHPVDPKNAKHLAVPDLLKLLPILALAFYIAFIPHQGYPYPVHWSE